MTPTERRPLPRTSRLERAALEGVDASWLAAFRVLFGLILAVSMQRLLAYGWVDELLVAPRFKFRYWVVEQVFHGPLPLPSREGMHALVAATLGLGLLVAAGAAFRVTAPLFAAGLTYVQLVDVSTYLNHYWLAGLLAWLLAASPAHRVGSVDAWVRARRGAPARPTVPRAWLWTFRFQVAVVYVGASLAKLQGDWLVHGQPLGIWLGARTDVPVLGALFTLPGAPLVMSWAGFVFDGTVPFWLSRQRTRPFAYAVVLGFHGLTRVLFDIGMFPVIMSAAALVFFPPDWPRRLAARWTGRPAAAAGGVADEAPVTAVADAPRATPWLSRAALAAAAAWCLFQALFPLRCHLYGGNVLWHEQGMRFSWRVMVRAKGGATTFVVREADTGRVRHVSPREYLTPYQENEMAGQPDLVLQLAHRIRDDFDARGHGPAEVRVDSRVSLNGRPAAPMIDPAVDLARVEDGLAPAPWILPAPAGPPPPTRPVR